MKVSIAGAYQTRFGELWDKSLEDLIFEAGVGALKDAEIDISKIEAIFLGNMLSFQGHLAAKVASLFGVRVPVLRFEAACASGGVAFNQAFGAIERGEFKNCLVIGAEKMTDFTNGEITAKLMSAACQEEYLCGLSFVGLYALMAVFYMNSFGATCKDLANVAVKNHFHASFNPKAQFPFPITLKQVLESPVVAYPLKLLDCSPISDGAAAVVLTSKNKTRKKVKVLSAALTHDFLGLKDRENLDSLKSSFLAGQTAYRQASLGPKDVDFLEVHDCFTIAEILALEDLGFYEKGEGFLAEGNGEVKLGGRRPVNLSGGLKACGHPVGATGVKQIVEIVNQLRERAGKRQMKNARVGLAHNVGGSGSTAVVSILSR